MLMDSKIYNPKFQRDCYICDPNKNTACNKHGCFWSGKNPDFNQCFCTEYFQYAVGRYEDMERLLREYRALVIDISTHAQEGEIKIG